MAVTAAMVKQLRDKTGAGMMDCKKALTESGADLEAATDWLRKKGLAAAAKKSGRVAAEGLVAVATAGNRGVVVEVNAETDFVARNADFQTFVRTVAAVALTGGTDLEALAREDYPGTGRSVGDELTHNIATIGENMTIRRASMVQVKRGVVVPYVHNAVSTGLGKIGVLVGLESDGDADRLGELGKQLAMHVAATAPRGLAVADLDPALVARERTVLEEQAMASGKPASVVEKMVEGRLRKFYQETVLLEQTFVIDNETRIAKVLDAAARDLGTPVAIAGFARLMLGEGVEREEKDFAAEVAAQLRH